jgi:hypothetical protein
MESYILKILLVVGWSAVKYIFGFLSALRFDFSFIEVLLTNVGGGMIGVIVYLYLWEFIVKIYRKFFPRKPKAKEDIKISRTRRWILKVVVKYELYGIAFLTPLLLSVPGGTLMAAALEPDKWRIKRYMFFSFLGWTLALYGLKALFGIHIDEWF